MTDRTMLMTDLPLHNATILIHNYMGLPVHEISNVNSSPVRIENSDLSNGVYFVKIYQDHQLLVTEKLLVTK